MIGGPSKSSDRRSNRLLPRQSSPHSQKHIPFGLWTWALLLILIIVPRLWNFTNTIQFGQDQGIDMIVVWHMEHTGHHPLIGPFLSLPNFYTPPTYYYLTWAFYHAMDGSVNGVVYGYFVLNVLSILALIALTNNIGGKHTAIWMAFLLAISITMINHSRNIWQPFPIQFFLSLWLLGVWHAHIKKNTLLMYGATVCFVIALSIYPSPAILVPTVIYQLMQWQMTVKNHSPRTAFFVSVGIFAAMCLVVFIPQLIFEITHHFPSLRSAFTSFYPTTVHQPLLTLLQNVYALLCSFVPIQMMTPIPQVFFGTIIVLLLILFAWKAGSYSPFSKLYSPVALGLGCLILMLPLDIHPHRTWALLPFLFLFSAIGIDSIWKTMHLRALIWLFIGIYTTFNIYASLPLWTKSPYNSIRTTKTSSLFIQKDVTARQLSKDDFGIFYKIPNDPDNGNYGVFRYIYWLLNNDLYQAPLTHEGNMPQFNYAVPDLKPYMYIVCDNFMSSENAYTHCVRPIIENRPYRTLREVWIDETIIFIITNESPE